MRKARLIAAMLVLLAAGGNTDGFSPAQQRLLADYRALNSACRGGSGNAAATWHACARREVLWPDLRAAGLCLGRTGDASSAEMEWHLCRADSLALADQLHPVPEGRCRLAVDGRRMLDGPCLVQVAEDGGIMDPAQRIFASVDLLGPEPSAMVAAEGTALPRHGDRGTVTREGACWVNAAMQICAWR